MAIRVGRCFPAAVREQNISKAAASLHLAQPTLSRQLADPEAEIGPPLSGAGAVSLFPELVKGKYTFKAWASINNRYWTEAWANIILKASRKARPGFGMERDAIEKCKSGPGLGRFAGKRRICSTGRPPLSGAFDAPRHGGGSGGRFFEGGAVV